LSVLLFEQRHRINLSIDNDGNYSEPFGGCQEIDQPISQIGVFALDTRLIEIGCVFSLLFLTSAFPAPGENGRSPLTSIFVKKPRPPTTTSPPHIYLFMSCS
jgi:hypothetical protein